jgi:hypothetical protein
VLVEVLVEALAESVEVFVSEVFSAAPSVFGFSPGLLEFFFA